MLKILTKREKTMLRVAAAAIACGVYAGLFLAPALKKNDALNAKMRLTATKLQRYTQLLSQKDAIRKEYGRFISDLKTAGKKEDTMVSTLSELEGYAGNASIRLTDVRPQPAKNEGAYKVILIDVRAEGSMENFLKFIYSLENSLSLLRVERLQLGSLPNSQALQGNLSISKLAISE